MLTHALGYMMHGFMFQLTLKPFTTNVKVKYLQITKMILIIFHLEILQNQIRFFDQNLMKNVNSVIFISIYIYIRSIFVFRFGKICKHVGSLGWYNEREFRVGNNLACSSKPRNYTFHQRSNKTCINNHF